VADRPVHVKRLRVALPSTATRAAALPGVANGWRFESPEGALEIGVEMPWPIDAKLVAMRDEPDGRGPRLPLPLHLQIESRETMMLTPKRSQSWSLWLRVRPAGGGAVETALHSEKR
jgi:hypothetical protein